MTVKKVARQQYRDIVDRAARHAVALRMPPEGWLRTARKALQMSGAQLAKKMNVTRARVAQAEEAELTGGVTLKSMRAAAEAMGCRFVYAIVPPKRTQDIIMAQARKKATSVVGTASEHMALESQTLSKEQIAQEVARLTREIASEMPPDFWRDK
jgi:predicted DNA-binding mobile mystery protein A